MTEPISENQNTPDGNGKPEKQPDGSIEQVSTTVAKSELPPSHGKRCKPHKKKRDWFDYGKGILEIFGLVVLCIYAAYTIKIYNANQKAADAAHDTLCEIQKQTRLMRQQLVGTMAAVVIIGDSPRWDRATQKLTFLVINTGSLIGTVTSFDATIQRKSLPKEIPIGDPVKIHISNQQIEKGSTYKIEKGIPWILPEVKDVRLWPGKEIVTVNGSYAYDNGFGESISHNVCFLWMPGWSLQMPNPNQGGWGGGGWGWGTGREPCRTVEEMKNEFLGIQRHIKEASTPQH
jgi:hypothetical protein